MAEQLETLEEQGNRLRRRAEFLQREPVIVEDIHFPYKHIDVYKTEDGETIYYGPLKYIGEHIPEYVNLSTSDKSEYWGGAWRKEIDGKMYGSWTVWMEDGYPEGLSLDTIKDRIMFNMRMTEWALLLEKENKKDS